MYECRDVHPHSQNYHKLSSLSIWPDPVPPVRLLLTHVILGRPVRREAGISESACKMHNAKSQVNAHALDGNM